MKKTYLSTTMILSVILTMTGCSQGEVLYERPDTPDGYEVFFTLPPKVHETIYPTTRASTWGLKNEFDLASCVIYMFEETSTGAGYKYMQSFDLSSTSNPAIDVPGGGSVLSSGGTLQNQPRPFTLKLGPNVNGTSIKRFYFVGNLGTEATDTKLGSLTLTQGVTDENDFCAAFQTVTNGYIAPVATETTPLSLPMYSWQGGKPYLEVDLSSNSSTNNVNMVRSVARFDVVNYATADGGSYDAVASDFTISTIYIGGAAKKGYVLPGYADPPYSAAAADRTGATLTYQPGDAINKTGFTIDASGVPSTSAATPTFYLLPTNLNSTTTTIQIEGTILGGKVIKNVVPPATAANDWMQPNRLYRIYITKTNDPQNEVDISMVVKDWEDELKLAIAPATRSFSELYLLDAANHENLVSNGAYKGSVKTGATDTTRLKFYYYSDRANETPFVSFDFTKYPYVQVVKGAPTITRAAKQYCTAYTVKIPNDKKRVIVNSPLTISAPGGIAANFNISHLAMGTGDFAFSNIYWDGTKLTFDTIPDPATYPTRHKQGVLFRWGSLIGVSPNGSWDKTSTKLYVPDLTNKTWLDDKTAVAGNNPWNADDWAGIPYVTTNYNNDAADYDPRADNKLIDITDYSNYTGDICVYLTQTGAVKGNWRMATLNEVTRNAQYEIGKGYTFETANAISNIWSKFGAGWQNIAETTDDGTYLFNHGLLVDNIDYFPPQGERIYENGRLSGVGREVAIWLGSAPLNSNSGFLLLCFESGLSPHWKMFRTYGLPVRCVKNQ